MQFYNRVSRVQSDYPGLEMRNDRGGVRSELFGAGRSGRYALTLAALRRFALNQREAP